MAVELEKFLVDQLGKYPKDSPERKFLEGELVRTRLHLMGIISPKEILTEEFALRINRVTSIIPDDVPLNKLHYSTNKAFGYNINIIDHELPYWQVSWRTFRASLKGREQKELTAIFNSFIREKLREGQTPKTVGDLRQTSLDELSDTQQYRNIGPRRAIFIKVAFMR